MTVNAGLSAMRLPPADAAPGGSDGFGEPLTVRCRCEVAGDSLWVDFAGSSPASRRGVNVVMNYTEAYTTYGVKVIVSPDVPNNEGAFRPLTITAPPGSILNVQRRLPDKAERALKNHDGPRDEAHDERRVASADEAHDSPRPEYPQPSYSSRSKNPVP